MSLITLGNLFVVHILTLKARNYFEKQQGNKRLPQYKEKESMYLHQEGGVELSPQKIDIFTEHMYS